MDFHSTARIALPDADLALARLTAHAREHDADLKQAGPRDVSIFVGEDIIRLASDGEKLAFTVSAQSESILYFLKEYVVRHLEALHADAARALRWEQGGVTPAGPDTPPNFHEMTVAGKSAPMPGLIRLYLRGERVEELAGPGIHVKLMLPVHEGRRPVWPTTARNGVTVWPDGEDALHVRYYTVKSVDPAGAGLEIDIVRHQGGLIAEWADAAAPGATIGLLGPAGGEMPAQGTNDILLCADRTALPALARMLEALPASVSGHVVGEAATTAELQDYLPKTSLELHALDPELFRRDVWSACVEIVRDRRPDFAWFAGEFANAQEMRHFFKSDLDLPKGRQFSISYWRKGESQVAN